MVLRPLAMVAMYILASDCPGPSVIDVPEAGLQLWATEPPATVPWRIQSNGLPSGASPAPLPQRCTVVLSGPPDCTLLFSIAENTLREGDVLTILQSPNATASGILANETVATVTSSSAALDLFTSRPTIVVVWSSSRGTFDKNFEGLVQGPPVVALPVEALAVRPPVPIFFYFLGCSCL
jgi:hypothetical protein